MPKKSVPKYSHHKASGRAYVFINGNRVYLGKHGTPESHRRYADEIAKWQSRQTEATENVTIRELTLLYLKRAEKHYQKDGKITSEVHCIQSALRIVNRLCKDELANQFSPMMLSQVRQAMIEQGLCRKVVNKHVGRIVRAWKWAVSQGLVQVGTWQALTTLQGLQAGRTEARESDPIKPVPLRQIEAVKPLLARPLQGAVEFQLATAARPGEALNLRLAEIDRSGPVWLYRPGSHKTQHHDTKSRLILIGPKAHGVVMEHAKAHPKAFAFAVPGTNGTKAYFFFK